MKLDWLKRIGMVLAGAANKIGVLAPVVGQLVTTFAPALAPQVDGLEAAIGGVLVIEGAVASLVTDKGISGPDKAKMASTLVAQAFLSTGFMKDKKIADQAAFAKAMGTIAGGVADALKALEPAEVTT